jgi:hypothetical protein
MDRSPDEAAEHSGGVFRQLIELLEMLGLVDTADKLVEARADIARSNARTARAVRHFGFSALPWIMTLGYLGGVVAFTFFKQRRSQKGLP